MKSLLIVIAILEAAAGLALLFAPSMSVSVLLGSPLDMPGGLAVARIAGAALLALGTACWLARNEGPGRAARTLVMAMLLYNGTAAAVLVHAGLEMRLSRSGLWPAVVLHLGLAVWCIACLRSANPSRLGFGKV